MACVAPLLGLRDRCEMLQVEVGGGGVSDNGEVKSDVAHPRRPWLEHARDNLLSRLREGFFLGREVALPCFGIPYFRPRTDPNDN